MGIDGAQVHNHEIMQAGYVVPGLQRADDREVTHAPVISRAAQQVIRAPLRATSNALAISSLAAALNICAPRFVVLDDVTSSFDRRAPYFRWS